ncbi:hypothetical protein [Ktedonospora formicarum]|uniref:Uncharacterized protein n=1 Tax=Ktedonospora formicarum TaxID=2778364 RepID=A0A8J3I3L4_9CHLR|nr:hypothetical protein [Ktedonospora formicarum]GHO46148.1 hypothetical protein KSX_43110 [Ktedonospora formicarum]
MKELENIIAGAELNDADLEMISGRGDGGYGGGKGGFVQGGRSDLRVVNNFSFRNNTNVSGVLTIPVTVSDFNCNSFNNIVIGGGDGY